MCNKLAFRNAKRLIKDYFLYLITMILITSLMFAFNSMIFSEDIIKMFSMAGVMAVMIGLATFFIIFVVSYIKKEGKGIFNKEKLLLLRQFASKIKTMEFTMATLTILFIFSIIGCSIAMMLGDYLNKSLDAKLPFDIIAFSDSINDDFEEYIDVIEKNTKIKDKFIYNIYEDGTDNINMYLRNEFKYENSESNSSEYFDYDTYMKVSDYNKLRKMLGYSEVTLFHKGFFIQGKKNINILNEN